MTYALFPTFNPNLLNGPIDLPETELDFADPRKLKLGRDFFFRYDKGGRWKKLIYHCCLIPITWVEQLT